MNVSLHIALTFLLSLRADGSGDGSAGVALSYGAARATPSVTSKESPPMNTAFFHPFCHTLIALAVAFFLALLVGGHSRAQAASPLLPTSPPSTTGLLTGIQALATGGWHTCALTTAGGVKCWGDNSGSQLGDQTTDTRYTPVDVSGLTSGVQAIAAGYAHTCALTTAGSVKCWGDNSGGQLGDGTTTSRSTPVEVIGLSSGVLMIAAGDYHTCALTAAGGVKCWGRNNFGQLGDGTTTERWTPADVSSLTTGVKMVAAGEWHTCALTTGRGLKCWGANHVGQVGDGTTTTRYTPADVSSLASGVQMVAVGGYHTCALTTTSGIKCWGGNWAGQVGDGTTTTRYTPVDVSDFAGGVLMVASGWDHSCALTTAGGVKCWGGNQFGKLGDGTTGTRYTPVEVSGLSSGVQAVATGQWHTCVLTTASGVKCWGRNNFGQVGDGTSSAQGTPVDAGGITGGMPAVTAGGAHTCVLTTAGGVKCWGANHAGQVGDGTTDSRYTPLDVSDLSSGVQAVGAGAVHTCVLTTVGGVKCWGANLSGQLGDGTTTSRSTPADVSGLSSGVQMVAVGSYHTCALTTAGSVKCWGRNVFGQLGDGTTIDRWTPVDVGGLSSGVQAVSAGYGHTCALTTAGGVKCWGANHVGQLGDGMAGTRDVPVDVSGLRSGVQAVAAGSYHTCALTTGGGVKCWGWNEYGQVGDGTSGIGISRSTPADVNGLSSDVQAVAANTDYTCALTILGGVKCWGHNSSGQLGDGTTTDRWTPVDVSGLTSGVQAVATARGGHICALAAAGNVKCWGNNEYGQVGISPEWTPVDVVDRGPLLDAAELATQGNNPTVAPGATVNLRIQVRNIGQSTWQAGGGFGWRGTGQWQGQNGVIGGPVAPGQVWPFIAPITAPQQPGSYVYGFVLQHNGADFSTAFSAELTVISSAVLPGFQVSDHGFSFANGSAYTSTLAAEAVYGTFGDSACWQSSGPQCTIRHDTAMWANRAVSNSSAGQGNGMSITSLRFYHGLDQPSALQPEAAQAHDMSAQTLALPQHIMSYQIRWDIPEVQRRLAARPAMTVGQVLAAVEQGLVAGGGPLVLYIASETSAHALTPYKVERMGEDDARIYVYDSNYPDDSTRSVAVQAKSGTWQYEFAQGQVWSTRLAAYPAAAFAGPLPWEQHAVASSAGSAASVLISASPGLVLRGTNGEPLDRLLVPTGGPGPSPSIYILPQADRYDLSVDRSGVVGGPGSLLYMGPAGLLVVEGLAAAPVSDTLTLHSAANGLVYRPRMAAALTVTLSAADTQKNVLVTAGSIQLSAQAVLTAGLTSGQMAVALGGAEPVRYSLDMLLHSPAGVNQQFHAADVTLPAGATQIAAIPMHIGAALPINTVVVETGETMTEALENELVQRQGLFLPVIVR